MSDGRIIIDTSVDNSGLEKGVNSLEGVAKEGLKVFTGAIVATGVAMAGVGYKALGLASDLAEVQNVVDVTFGENASKINDWAKAADTAFGMSELQAKQFNGTMGAMLKSMGLTGDEVLNLSENMTGLAGDFASFYNLDAQDAFEKIRSGISGETEPLKQLGINMSVANLEAFALTQGMSKQYKEMSQSEQTLLRYNYLMSVSADAQGDFTRTQDSFANQLRIAKLNVQELGATLGNMLLPVAQETVKSFNGITGKLKEAFADPAVEESIKQLATAIGELITKIANFVVDHLPQIIEGFTWILNNANNIAAGIVGITVALEGFKVAALIMTLVEAFKLAKDATEGLTIAQWLYNIALAPIGGIIGLLVIAIVALVAVVIYLWNTNEDFRNAIIGIWETIKETAISVWGAICDFFTKTIPNAFNAVIDFFKNNWKELLLFIVNPFAGAFALLYKNCDGFKGFIDKFIKSIVDFFTNGWNDIVSFFASVGDWFVQLWADIKQIFVDGCNSVFSFLTETIPSWIDSITAWFNALPRNIGYMLGYLLGCFVNGLQMIWDIITITIPGIVTSIINWFAELPGKIMALLAMIIIGITIWGIQLYEETTTWVSNTVNGIINWFAALPGQIMVWLIATITNIAIWGSQMYQEVTSWVSSTINGVIDWFSSLPGAIQQWLLSTIINIIAWGIELYAKTNQAASDTVDGIMSWFEELPGNMLDIGRNIVTGIWDGIVGAKDWLFDKIGSFAGGIADGFKDALHIHSPSRLMRDLIGTNIVKGIGVGIDLETPNLLSDVDTNMSDLVARMKGTVDYETARTTAGVVASKNKLTGVDTIGDTSKGKNIIENHIHLYCEGKELAYVIAPHQDVLDEYNVGRG